MHSQYLTYFIHVDSFVCHNFYFLLVNIIFTKIKIMSTIATKSNFLTGGQFTPKWGGQFAPKCTGQFVPK
jgi:hypothetical protein